MRGWSFVVGVILAMCATAPAMGEILTVQNASFEDHVLPAGAYTYNGVGLTPWTFDPGLDVGVWNISDGTAFPDGAPDGVNVAYSHGPSISQVLSDVVVEGMTLRADGGSGQEPLLCVSRVRRPTPGRRSGSGRGCQQHSPGPRHL